MDVGPEGYAEHMEPIPQTLQAFSELDAVLDDQALLTLLRTTADRAHEVVPGLVGVSVASRDQGVTFTLVATAEEIAVLDAVQYVASGPCVDAMDLGHGITTSAGGLLDEDRWSDFARASAAAGIRSTLTLPVFDGDDVVGTVNFYGRDNDTFLDHHDTLADIFGAWAPGAVADADMTFATRDVAEHAPELLRQSALVDTATGILAAQRGTSVADARTHLESAARRAGITVELLAAVVVKLHRDEE
jgi:GAF domain-containing protein